MCVVLVGGGRMLRRNTAPFRREQRKGKEVVWMAGDEVEEGGQNEEEG